VLTVDQADAERAEALIEAITSERRRWRRGRYGYELEDWTQEQLDQMQQSR